MMRAVSKKTSRLSPASSKAPGAKVAATLYAKAAPTPMLIRVSMSVLPWRAIPAAPR